MWIAMEFKKCSVQIFRNYMVWNKSITIMSNVFENFGIWFIFKFSQFLIKVMITNILWLISSNVSYFDMWFFFLQQMEMSCRSPMEFCHHHHFFKSFSVWLFVSTFIKVLTGPPSFLGINWYPSPKLIQQCWQLCITCSVT